MINKIKEFFKPNKKISRILFKLSSYSFKHNYMIAGRQFFEMALKFKDNEYINNHNKNKYIDLPSNNNDIEGIYKYLSYHFERNSLNSNCFEYLFILKQAIDRKNKLLDRCLKGIYLTVDYVGLDILRPYKGWEWYDSGSEIIKELEESYYKDKDSSIQFLMRATNKK